MTVTDEIYLCRSCGSEGTGSYCNKCGQPYKTKRINLSNLLHDVFHFFTHLDKGFGYTIKQLSVAPGRMQRNYIEGERSKHQKPFPMFFICATITALSRYWIFKALMKYYNTGSISEANFFHEYMVILHIALLPLYAFITYLFFIRSKYNYAEIGVLLLYSVSFLFFAASLIALLKFLWPGMDTAYIELPVFLVYNSITFINFFYETPPWKVILKSIIIFTIIFLLIQVAEDYVVQAISGSE